MQRPSRRGILRAGHERISPANWQPAARVVTLVVAAKGLAFLREAFVALELGTTGSSDAYYLAFALPTVLYNLGALPFSLWVTARLAADGPAREEQGRGFYARSVWLVFGVGVVGLLAVTLASAGLVGLYAPGLDANRALQAVAVTRFGALAIPALGIQAVSNGKLFARGLFATAYGWLALSGLVGLGVVVACTPVYGAQGAVFGFVAASWVAALGGVWSAREAGPPPGSHGGEVLSEDFGVGVVYRAIIMQLFFQGSLLLVYGFGSGLPPGHLAASLFAGKVQTALYETLVVTAGVLVYPRIAERLHAKDHRAVWDAVVRALGWLLPATATVVVLLIVCRSEIVTLLYKRQAFDDRSVALVSASLLGLAPGLLGLTLVEILHRAMVLRGRLVGYAVAFGAALAVNWWACRLLVPSLGVLGVTLGTSVGATGAAVALLAYAIMRLHAANTREVLVLSGRTLAASIVGLAVLLAIRARTGSPRTALEGLLFVAGGGVLSTALLWVGLSAMGHRWTSLVGNERMASGGDRP